MDLETLLKNFPTPQKFLRHALSKEHCHKVFPPYPVLLQSGRKVLLKSPVNPGPKADIGIEAEELPDFEKTFSEQLDVLRTAIEEAIPSLYGEPVVDVRVDVKNPKLRWRLLPGEIKELGHIFDSCNVGRFVRLRFANREIFGEIELGDRRGPR